MPRKLNHYVVTINIRNGEYEKLSKKLIYAANELAAGRMAVEGELHHDIGDGAEWDGEDEQAAEDAHGEWYYKVKEARPVHADDAETLKKYFW